MTLSFKHAAAEYMFKCLAAYLSCETAPAIDIEFAVNGNRMEVHEISQHDLSNITRGFVPLGLSYGTNMSHQGAVIISGGRVIIYEPYGTYKKKIKGVLYSYYDALASEFARYGPVENYHEGRLGIQSIVLDREMRRYDEFLAEFNQWIASLRKRDPKTVAQLRDELSGIDISSESSKLAYLTVAAASVQRNCGADLFYLYARYSPYSCVSFTVVEIAEFFAPGTADLYAAKTLADTWQIIETAMRKIAPKFVQFIEGVAPCKLMDVQVWSTS